MTTVNLLPNDVRHPTEAVCVFLSVSFKRSLSFYLENVSDTDHNVQSDTSGREKRRDIKLSSKTRDKNVWMVENQSEISWWIFCWYFVHCCSVKVFWLSCTTFFFFNRIVSVDSQPNHHHSHHHRCIFLLLSSLLFRKRQEHETWSKEVCQRYNEMTLNSNLMHVSFIPDLIPRIISTSVFTFFASPSFLFSSFLDTCCNPISLPSFLSHQRIPWWCYRFIKWFRVFNTGCCFFIFHLQQQQLDQ